MKKKRNQSPEASALRQRAEERLNTSQSGNASAPHLDVGTQRILHEMEVHQIELEMQNEELRRTSLELETSQERYFDLFDLAPVGFVILNEKGMILETNLAETDLLGVARNTLVNLPLTRFILPEDQDIYYNLRKRLFDTRTPQECELRMLRASVSPFWAELRVTVGQDSNGMLVCRAVMIDITERKRAEQELRRTAQRQNTIPAHFENDILTASGERRLISWNNIVLRDAVDRAIGTNSIGEDITERKLAEEALRESEDRYRLLYDSSLDAILLTTPDGKILSANSAACHMFERTEEELRKIGRSGIVDTSNPRLALAIEERNRTGRFFGELTLLRQNGTKFPCEVSTSLFKDKNGNERSSMIICDITERKQAEEVLGESQALLTAIVDSTSDLIWSVDSNRFRLLTFNNSFINHFLNTLGIRIQTGMRIEDIYQTEEFIERWRGFYQRALTEGSYSTDYLTYTGSNILNLRFSLLKRDGKVFGISVFGKDITEHKQAEDALRRSEAALKQAQRVAHVGSWIWHIQSNQLEWSNEMYHIFGIPKENFTGDLTEVIGRAIHPADRAKVEQSNLRITKGKQPVPLEYRVVWPDGTVRVVWAEAGDLILDKTGKPVVLTGIVQDITESKRAEEALRKSQQLLEKTFTSLLDAVIIIDADTMEIIDCNPATSEIFGYSRQEMLGQTTAFLHVDQPALEEFRQHLNPEVVQKGFLFMPEFRMKRKDGTVFPTEHSEVPLENEQGKRIGWVSVVRDITERIRAENELAQSHEQLHALTAYWQATVEAERAYIAREIHDEFGQSMTALKMDLAWLTKRLPQGDERVNRIRGMNTLIDDSITLMRRIATELRPNLLDDLGLNAALEWQAREFSRHSGIPCRVTLPEQDLNLDPALSTTLFRIFQETLTNVARHAQATHIHVSLQKKNQTVILTIRDNGRGISEGELNDPHSLGLLGLRERAAQWGGKTTIRETAGKGTTVTVSIPLLTKTTTGGDR